MKNYLLHAIPILGGLGFAFFGNLQYVATDQAEYFYKLSVFSLLIYVSGASLWMIEKFIFGKTRILKYYLIFIVLHTLLSFAFSFFGAFDMGVTGLLIAFGFVIHLFVLYKVINLYHLCNRGGRSAGPLVWVSALLLFPFTIGYLNEKSKQLMKP